MEEEPWTEVDLTGVLAASHSVVEFPQTRADGGSWAVLMQEHRNVFKNLFTPYDKRQACLL